MKKNREIKSYVLRSSRMTPLQKKAYRTLFNLYGIQYSENILDFKKIFKVQDIIVEIGFGMGEATIEIAEKNRDKGYIAIDVHKPGIGKLLDEIEKRGLDNIKVIEHDAIKVFNKMILDQILLGVHIFFPDPWPKKRHHKRRLIKEENIKLISSKLKRDGYIYICTDWEDYAIQILNVMKNIKILRNKYKVFASKQIWRPKTKFEKKGIEKSHKIWEVFFKKI